MSERISEDWDSARSEGLWGTDAHLAPEGDPDGDSRLDPGVYEIVWGLWEVGVKTFTSCQGGGYPHAFMFRTVMFGLCDEEAGPRALAVAQKLNMPVHYLVRVHCATGQQEPETFWWEMHFDRFINWTRADHRGFGAHDE